jgi:uncharacterized protein (TIGR02611 family)
LRGLFVTGTGTGVGKSVVAAAVCATLAARGERVAAFKPVVTGLGEPVGARPHDHELLAAAASAGQAPDEVAPYRFDLPVSPHFAARLAGQAIEPALLLEAARRAAARRRGAERALEPGDGGAPGRRASQRPASHQPRLARCRRAHAAARRVACTLSSQEMATEEAGRARDSDDRPELLVKLQERKERHRQRHWVHRVAVVLLGFLIVLAGMALSLPTVPGPGIVVILIGLGFLALEFDRAERLLEKAIIWGDRAAERAEQTSTGQRVVAGVVTTLAIAGFVAAAILWDIPLLPVVTGGPAA